MDEAVRAAAAAQPRVAAMGLEDRGRMIAIIRRISDEQADALGRMELEETRIGRLDHKIAKLKAMRYVLGVEAMRSDARSDRTGLCVIERAPWGVIGMVLPATHSVPTLVSNAINVLAAGNTAVFNPHPAGARVAAHALALFNRAIEPEVGVANVITTVAEPSIETAEQIFSHPGVALLCVTGGPAVVKAAAQSGKRVIAGGPGNPPVVVDEDADLDLAARSIIAGAAFDNNLLCIGEKEVFVLESVADDFIAAMKRAGAVLLDARAIGKLTEAAFTFDGPGKGCGRAHVKKDLLGRDPSVLAAAAGVTRPAGHRAAVRRDRRGASLRAGRADDAVPAGRARAGHRRRDRGGTRGRARLPAHRDHPHAQRGARDPHGADARHDAVRPERRVDRGAGRGRARLLQPHDRDAHRRRHHDAADVHARAAVRHRRRDALHLEGATMFLARIDGTLTAAKKHDLLAGVRFLLAQRLEADGATSGEPLVLLDRMGARHGSTVLVSTDGDIAREWLGTTVPARLVVVGIVDRVGRGAGARERTS